MEDFDPSNYPPRYRSVSERGGFKELICDEYEWLARPDLWGTSVFPERVSERKYHLGEYHLFTRDVEAYVGCPVCKPVLRDLYSESGFDAGACVLQHAALLNLPTGSDRREWVKVRPERCECPNVVHLRALKEYPLGRMSSGELKHHVRERLRIRANPVADVESPPEVVKFLHEDVEARQKYVRWLALELCGPNPFRPVNFHPQYRTDTAVGVAGEMDDTRDFSAMHILADALQDAGCEEEAILKHCREEPRHVRGCWVVDLVLGTQ
jgi:hypothetical protein